MATIKEVASLSGVTVTTVSRMLNGRGYISEKTKNNIMKAIHELNYQPNEIARALSLKKSKFIGLIVPSASNPFFCKIIDSIEHHASFHGYKLFLCNSNREIKKEIEYFGMLNANKVAGVIVTSHTQDLEQSIKYDDLVISIDRVISSQIPSICSDNYRGGVLAAEHLISKGCKKLAHISGSLFLNMDANKRYYGFHEVCEKRNIPHIVLDANEEQFLSMRYEDIVASLLDNNQDVDGIFTSNDILAAQVIQACYARGIHIPEQMKIVGYDDIDLCTLCTPQITTIHQSIDDICQYAVECIVFKSEKRAIPNSVTFPVSLIERGTT
jgi:LacI family transcriptional regulator, sucrose operon repressor